MKVYRELILDMTRMDEAGNMPVLFEDSYQYYGPVALAGGGPSREQKDAAAAQANLSNEQAQTGREMLGFWKDQYNKITPFATERMNNGLPFYNSLTDFSTGTNAQAFAPEMAALNRTLSNYGSLPSGFATQTRTDLQAKRARGFDSALTQNLMANEQAKTNAAGMLVGQQQLTAPQQWMSGASQGYSSVMNAPLASPGIGGLIGGMAGAGMSALGF
jgi:hypothetical protein